MCFLWYIKQQKMVSHNLTQQYKEVIGFMYMDVHGFIFLVQFKELHVISIFQIKAYFYCPVFIHVWEEKQLCWICASASTGSQRRCPSHLYQCASGECLDPALVCNGLTNCVDRSDEGKGCAQRNCSSPSAPSCDHHCVSTPDGPVSTEQIHHWLLCCLVSNWSQAEDWQASNKWHKLCHNQTTADLIFTLILIWTVPLEIKPVFFPHRNVTALQVSDCTLMQHPA